MRIGLYFIILPGKMLTLYIVKTINNSVFRSSSCCRNVYPSDAKSLGSQVAAILFLVVEK